MILQYIGIGTMGLIAGAVTGASAVLIGSTAPFALLGSGMVYLGYHLHTKEKNEN